ncbi:N,N-dimethylformamidase beta subunit family domain-containing protein [Streptomyces atroolivaceus]|uniref:N,N-dimethylformamidase beta subunit family domain-containing protein n=1 Tax=Streptomyces atroolivaceus TaxID=66869 RepID=UPI002024ED7B|nr:N,N-dimethylformamidase beta subunit family domain-containing protein [Streptomyces atroolivaceus]
MARPVARTGGNLVTEENGASGSDAWIMGRDGTTAADDKKVQIQGYASKSSVPPGESIDFHISSRVAQTCTVEIYRLGHYGGVGARYLTTGEGVRVSPRPKPEADQVTGLIACDWPVSWTLDVPRTWVSGMFLAVFTSVDGYRGYTPFVVRDTARRSDVLMVVPFTTYQAYNIWPFDGRIGKNLYRGFKADGTPGGNPERAFRVSFDRPYSEAGLPSWFDMDTSAARWAEEAGYDITYASSLDLHEGRVDASRYTAIIFSGHDEYWSKKMRDATEEALAAGTHLAFLGANNIYFHIRVEASEDGRAGRIVTCYKQDPDPEPGEGGATERRRALGRKHRKAEHALLGVQYNGMISKPVPLVVQESKHWFWSGTGLRDGDEIPDLVAVEADGFDPSMPRPEDTEQTLLSKSPYDDSMGRGRRIQNTSLCEDQRGTLVFVAGTFHWPLALSRPENLDPQVRRATRNLMDRMLQPRG